MKSRADTATITLGGAGTSKTGLIVACPVVATVTADDCGFPPLTCTEELDREQVGAESTAGDIAQLNLTVPVNCPAAVTSRLKVAFCPALIVLEAAADESSKSGWVVFSITPNPPAHRNSRSGRPSPFMSATRAGPLLGIVVLMGAPKVPSPLPMRIPHFWPKLR